MEDHIAQQLLLTIALLFLGGGAMFDVRKRALPGSFLLVTFLLGTAAGIFLRGDLPWGYVLSLLPGIFLLLLVPTTRGGIGAGDGLLILAVGTVLPLETELGLLLIGLLLASGYAICLLLRRKKRTATFPLVPFLLGGYLLLLPGIL